MMVLNMLCAYLGYFNSIKVRLKHDGSEYVVRLSWIFQFHKGTIKTQILNLEP